jgi:hypothetical protein
MEEIRSEIIIICPIVYLTNVRERGSGTFVCVGRTLNIKVSVGIHRQ